jgi:hypothetical protein
MLQHCENQIRAYLRGITQDDDALAQRYYAALSPLLMESALGQYLGHEAQILLGRPVSTENYRPSEEIDTAIRGLHTHDRGSPDCLVLPLFKTTDDIHRFLRPPDPQTGELFPGNFLRPPDPQIGELVPGKGIYAGIWEPKDRNGRSLGKIFDLYAAPKDIEGSKGKKILLTFNKAVRHVAGLRNWNGHDGSRLESDDAIYEAVRAGRYADLEKWFIPTKDILTENVYKNKDTGAFKGTFTTASGSDLANWYWSSSELRENPSFVYDFRLSDGNVHWGHKDNGSLSCRPLRAELRP